MGCKLRKWLVVALIACGCFRAHPAVAGGTAHGGDARFDRALEFGLMLYHFDYREDLAAPAKSTEKGGVPGLRLGMVHAPENAVYIKAFLEYAESETDFDGTDVQGNPVRDGTDNRFFRFEADVGYTFDLGGGWAVTPFTGYGYRTWKRQLGGGAPYDEDYRWSYLPLGVRFSWRVSERWTLQPRAAARYLFDGRVDATLSQVLDGLNDPRIPLGDAWGGYADMAVSYRLSPRWSVVGTPWLEITPIGRGKTAALTIGGRETGLSVTEPASDTLIFGFSFQAAWHF